MRKASGLLIRRLNFAISSQSHQQAQLAGSFSYAGGVTQEPFINSIYDAAVPWQPAHERGILSHVRFLTSKVK